NAVSSFNATNTTSGGIALTNTPTSGSLSIAGISQSGGGAVSISNAGNTTVSGAVSANGDMTIAATGSANDLTVGANVTETGSGTHTLTLNSDRNIAVQSGVSIAGASGKALNVTLDSNRSNLTGYISLANGTSISSFGGNIQLV